MTDYEKGRRKVRELIAKAERERDRKGYRENLGYDSQRKLSEYLSTLPLSYQEEAKLLDFFRLGCDQI